MYYSEQEMQSMFRSVGSNVLIDKSSLFFNPKKISLGSNIRIDAFCIFSASEEIELKNNIHIAAYVQMSSSSGKIFIDNFSGISSRCNLFTGSDDYSSGYLTGPTVPFSLRKVKFGDIILGKHVIIGCGSIIMPSVSLGIGSSVGALTFVNKSVPDYAIVSGNPAKIIKYRDKENLEKNENKFYQIKK